MQLFLDIIILVVLIYVLVKSADLLEESFVGFSKKLNVNTFTTGFVVLSITSSLPETLVAINAAADNAVSLSVGNLVGASLTLIALVTGLSAIKNKIVPFKGFYGTKEVLFSLTVIFTQVIAILDGRLDWIEGAVLMVLYLAFIFYVLNKSHTFEVLPDVLTKSAPNMFMRVLVGALGLILASNLTVDKALSIATALNIPTILLGLILFGIGTNLPELTIMIRSKGLQQNKLAMGNFIGSATANTFILGLLVILKPSLIQGYQSIVPALIALTVAIIIFAVAAISDREITRKEGYLLVSVFILYILTEVIIAIDLSS